MLRYLHNAQTVVVALTCKHNTDWQRFEDAHCAADNAEYDRFVFAFLICENSLLPNNKNANVLPSLPLPHVTKEFYRNFCRVNLLTSAMR